MTEEDKARIATLTAEDFAGPALYSWILGHTDPFTLEQIKTDAAKRAKELGVKNFSAMFKAYREKLKQFSGAVSAKENYVEYDGMRLNTGEWKVDYENGVWKKDAVACSHPILPVRILKSATVKVEIAFWRHNRWEKRIVPKSTISKTNDIVELADLGISVSSGLRAQALVDFLRDVQDLNQDVIPEVNSVSHLGWNGDNFVPFIGGDVLDAGEEFRPIYSAIHKKGSFEKWLEEMRKLRKDSMPARIAIDASFTSALIKILGCLPFFLHLWSADSGTGKTVAQMAAASVWGDPSLGGGLLQSFDSTAVATEITAGFLYSLPVILDELQLSKDNRGNLRFNVYRLAAGQGRSRSNRKLGISKTNTWANCFITSGESSIVSQTAGAGAYNRVLEIECKQAIVKDGPKTAAILKDNFGFAGEMFINAVTKEMGIPMVREMYNANLPACRELDTTGKQASAAAATMSGSQIAEQYIFKDGLYLTVEDMAPFLKSESEVSIIDRGYADMCGWVIANTSRFGESAPPSGEWYGVIRDGYACINRKIWNRACSDSAIDSRALLSGLKERGLLQLRKDGRSYTKTLWVGGMPGEYVCMHMKSEDELVLPF